MLVPVAVAVVDVVVVEDDPTDDADEEVEETEREGLPRSPGRTARGGGRSPRCVIGELEEGTVVDMTAEEGGAKEEGRLSFEERDMCGVDTMATFRLEGPEEEEARVEAVYEGAT